MATLRTVTVRPSGGDYTSLSAAESGEQADLVSLDRQLDIECYAMEDTTAVNMDGWTTDATRYIRIYTPASERHDGKWNTSKYRLSVTSGTIHAIQISSGADHVRIDGLQIMIRATTGLQDAIWMPSVNTNNLRRITNCIIKSDDANNTSQAMGVRTYGASSITEVWNCIFYDFADGVLGDAAINFRYANTSYIYNCTFVNNYVGISIHTSSGGTVYAKNCLFSANSSDTYGAVQANCDYNATNNSSLGYTSNTHDRTSQTFTFVDAANDDFHLAPTDAGARNYGVSDPGSGLFSTDIDGQTRSGTWDIGADEYVASGGSTYALTCSDGINAGELLSSACIFGCTIFDGINTGDGPGGAGNFLVNASDGSRIGEVVSIIQQLIGACQDGIRAGDSPSGAMVLSPALSDGVGLGDASSGPMVSNPTLVDGVRAGDSPSGPMISNVTAQDGLTIGDLISLGSYFALTIQDGINAGDSASTIVTNILTALDGVRTGDSSLGALIAQATVSDGIRVGESVSTSCQFNLTLADGIRLSDLANALGEIIALSVTDGLTASDSTVGAYALAGYAADGIRAGDASSSVASYLTTVTDGLSLGDALLIASVFACTSQDGINAGDWSTLGSLFSLTSQDGLILGESAITAIVRAVSISEAMRLGDVSSSSVEFNVTVPDGMRISDTISCICQFFVSALDGLQIGDLSIRFGETGAIVTFTAYGKSFVFNVVQKTFSFNLTQNT